MCTKKHWFICCALLPERHRPGSTYPIRIQRELIRLARCGELRQIFWGVGWGEAFITFARPSLKDVISASTNVVQRSLKKMAVFFPARQGVYYRGPCTDCSFTFQTLSITARDLMFSLSAQQSYSSPANSPAAILSLCMQYSQCGYHKALPSFYAFDWLCFHTVPVPYGTPLTQPEYSTLTQSAGMWRETAFCSVFKKRCHVKMSTPQDLM